MTWLSYSLDEVADFHPAFLEVGEAALQEEGLDHELCWLHHPQTAGVGVVPDFVLVERATTRWVLVVEIKRRPDAVTSERNQIQAKGYVEANAGLFRNGRPKYFAVTNLELTQLYALRNGLPPKDCLVEDGSLISGYFTQTPEAAHKAQLKADLRRLIRYSNSELNPPFAAVWPRIARSAYAYAVELPFIPEMDASFAQVPEIVRQYFSIDSQLSVRREVILRCLLIEYIRGILRRYDHPGKNAVYSAGTTIASVSNALVQLQAIDFSGVFENGSAATYLSFEDKPQIRDLLQTYLHALQQDNVSSLAETRGDSPSLPFELIKEAVAPAERDARGKAATDAELASLLAGMAITNPMQAVIDPGSGEGNLLSAAYDRLRDFGLTHAQVLAQIHGIEADSLAAKIAALRLALKEPRMVKISDPCHVGPGDLFSEAARIGDADVLLMNPPFKRYEVQDDAPVPQALREHYRNSILAISPEVEAEQGQTNLFALYVEFTVKAAKQGATLAIVLDNKWFHNENTRNIRSILLKYCRILAIVTYPHSRYFEGIMIATSMLVVEKVAASPADQVTFARVEDPGVASAEIAAAVIRGAEAPSGWSTRRVPQAELTSDSWKKYLSTDLIHEYRRLPLRSLPELFASGRRGSLAKEGGGIAVYEFPYRTQYGPRRSRLDNGNPFQTVSGEALTQNQNASLKALAASIPDEYRGYAINKADRIFGYELGLADVTRDWTIEGPEQRHQNFAQRYQSNRRARWTNDMNALVDNLRAAPATGLYVHAIEEHVGLDETVLPREQLWNVLREPYAGGLVVPRKQRSGHRVHVNPFAFEEGQRQIRLSSNFLSYGNCVCVDDANGLTAPIATRLVAAWLVSSFGHLQFELEANNREGARSIEQHHMDRIFVFDPRLIRHDHRDKILSAFRDLPFPIRTDLRVELQPLLVAMDKLFAAELAHVFPDFDPAAALTEVWSRLHEAHQARNA